MLGYRRDGEMERWREGREGENPTAKHVLLHWVYVRVQALRIASTRSNFREHPFPMVLQCAKSTFEPLPEMIYLWPL